MADISQETTVELDKTQDLYSQIEEDLKEFAQGATDFQIEVFIANGEGPIDRFPAHAYRHLLAQERTNRKMDRMREEKPLDWDLDILELEYKIKDLDIDLKGKWSTYQTYERLLGYLRETYGPFTHEDLQKQEAEYWEYRLSKQMFDSKQGAISAMGSGNLNSLRMAFQGSVLPDSPHRVERFNPEDSELIKILSKKSNELLGEPDVSE